MARVLTALAAAVCLAGCVTDGGSSTSGYSMGSRWDGYQSPFVSPFGFPTSPFGTGSTQGGGRTFRPAGDIVCDRATQTCYRHGQIDASDTRDYFGRRAAREVDQVRDQAGTNRIYRPSDDVVCNRSDKICYKNGHPDRSETRDYFGKKAARRVD